MYQHYVGIDWGQSTMAIARLTPKSSKPQVIHRDTDIVWLKEHVKSLKGKVILTVEESTAAQSIYVHLKGSVEKIVICNPRRNALLKEGAKTDKIDSIKLAFLLRGGF